VTATRADDVVITSVFIAGGCAAILVSPSFLLLTALMTMALVAASRGTPLVLALRQASGGQVVLDDRFPSSTRRLVTDLRARVSTAEARRLLDDVLRRSAALLGDLAMEARDASTRRDVVALAEAAAELTGELDRLDVFLALPEASHDPALRDRCRAQRERLVTRLGDAVSAIDTLHAQRFEQESDASVRVADLASELAAEARARRDALLEIASLLDGARS
jgi:hypothetical protein